MMKTNIPLFFPLALTIGTANSQHQTTVLDEPHVGGTIPYTVDIQEISLAPAAQPNLHISADATELSWDIGAGGSVFLLEDSAALESWDELATGLTSSPFALGTPVSDHHFYRLRSSVPVRP